MDLLIKRSGGQCELCSSNTRLESMPVDSDAQGNAQKCVLLCDTCRDPIQSGEPLGGGHWFCLQEAVWSEVTAVQVLSFRLLHRLEDQKWATNLLDQVYLEDEVLAWAERGLEKNVTKVEETVDSNGAVLCDGDSVTLIKDLDVKGAGFTAKRGTTVKNIRVGDDPTHIEGRINKMSIMLKTCFLKRASS